MSRVYVIQDQQQWNRDTKKLEPKFDLSPAKEFGELVFLLGPQSTPYRPIEPIQEMTKKLSSYHADDFLLLIGNPCLIGFAVAIAADVTGGKIRLLQWSGREQRYLEISANLFPDSSVPDLEP